MAGLVVVAGMAPRRGHEEVSVDSLVQQGVDGVGAWAKFEQRLGQLQANARVFPLSILEELADASATVETE